MTSEKSAFSAEERQAMKDRAKEQREFKKLSGEEQIKLKVAEMSPDEQKMAMELHELITSISPELKPRTWYGMPAYYFKDQVVCFFQSASKFKVRYSTFGFQEAAKVDDGDFWPTSYALINLTPAVKKQIADLVRKAIS